MDKATQLIDTLRSLDSVVVAYSGGVDSTFLAVMAHRALGPRALAVTAVSPSLAAAERAASADLAAQWGFPHRVIETNETDNPEYLANNTNRCYFCKDELYTHLFGLAAEEGFASVVDGFNADDLKDFRPGHKAGQKYGVRSPLFEAGLTKAEIRALSKEMGLPTWDKPALACLSSRFPYGTPIVLEVLGRIDAAESFLHSHGFRQVRVRHHDKTARIEVDPTEIVRFSDPATRDAVVARLRELGYLYVTVDLAGYRTGSMNEALPHLPQPDTPRRQT